MSDPVLPDSVSPTGRRVVSMGLIAALVLPGDATQAAAQPAASPFPAADWDRIAPDQAGWSSDMLSQAQDYAKRIGTATCLVVQHGRIVASWGDITRRLELHSMRKSLLSALIGMEVAEGRIDLSATLASLGIDDVPPSLSDAEKQATVRQLLQARSGVYHVALYETAGEQRLRPARGSHLPGTFWYYNNWDFNVLGTIYERAVGTSIFQAFQTRIATPLGMQDYRPSDGRYVTGPESSHPAYPFHMSARDLARFGLLYLRGGSWRGRQVVPAAWVRESTTGWSDTNVGSGYGYLWWTGFPDRWVPIMDLPPGGFWADGARGQCIIVDPAHDLVIVHQTNGTSVNLRQKGHLMWLLLNAAGASDPGRDPMA
jgi:CubicO group peptidase (beta-lactamase class C family)